jgi:hypothetical protein
MRNDSSPIQPEGFSNANQLKGTASKIFEKRLPGGNENTWIEFTGGTDKGHIVTLLPRSPLLRPYTYTKLIELCTV